MYKFEATIWKEYSQGEDDAVITFPATNREVLQTCIELDVPSLADCDLASWDCPLEYLNDQFIEHDRTTICRGNALNEINFLMTRLNSFSDYEMAIFEGLVVSRESGNLVDIINCSYNIECGALEVGDITFEQLGEHYLRMNNIPEEVYPYIKDMTALGQKWAKKDNSAIVDGAGYVYMADGFEFNDVYKGNTLPRNPTESDHLFKFTLETEKGERFVLKMPEQESHPGEVLNFLLKKFGVDSLNSCVVIQAECQEPVLTEMMENSSLEDLYRFSASVHESEMFGNTNLIPALKYLGIETPSYDIVNLIQEQLPSFAVYDNIRSPEDYVRKVASKDINLNVVKDHLDIKQYGKMLMEKDGVKLIGNKAVVYAHGQDFLNAYIQQHISDHSEKQNDSSTEHYSESPGMGGLNM